MRFSPGDLIGNKYRIVRLIGDGGMGTIYEARHEVLGVPIALKFLHPDLTKRPGLAARFLQEAKVSASIQSPHVARVTDVDTLLDGLPYLVMEYLHGETLQGLLNRQPKLPVDQAIDYGLQALSGLEAAHAIGVVHRDLKPDNIFITPSAGGPVIKVIDFGIAKLKVSSEYTRGLTRAGVMMGTPEYMAPEQLYSADQVDARADLYSVGTIIYEMLSGTRPADGDEATAIVAQVNSGQVPQLHHREPTVPVQLSHVVHRAMHPDRDARFASAMEFRLALAPFAGQLSHAGRLAATPAPATQTSPTPEPNATRSSTAQLQVGSSGQPPFTNGYSQGQPLASASSSSGQPPLGDESKTSRSPLCPAESIRQSAPGAAQRRALPGTEQLSASRTPQSNAQAPVATAAIVRPGHAQTQGATAAIPQRQQDQLSDHQAQLALGANGAPQWQGPTTQDVAPGEIQRHIAEHAQSTSNVANAANPGRSSGGAHARRRPRPRRALAAIVALAFGALIAGGIVFAIAMNKQDSGDTQPELPAFDSDSAPATTISAQTPEAPEAPAELQPETPEPHPRAPHPVPTSPAKPAPSPTSPTAPSDSDTKPSETDAGTPPPFGFPSSLPPLPKELPPLPTQLPTELPSGFPPLPGLPPGLLPGNKPDAGQK